MNDNEIKSCLDSVSGIWNRVTGTGGGSENSKDGDVRNALAGLIRHESVNLAELEALAEKTVGRAAAALRAIAGECRNRIKTLQTEYFIENGDTAAEEKTTSAVENMAEKLREAYLRAGELSEEYMLRSAGGIGKGLSELCYKYSLQLSEEQKRFRVLLRRMF